MHPSKCFVKPHSVPMHQLLTQEPNLGQQLPKAQVPEAVPKTPLPESSSTNPIKPFHRTLGNPVLLATSFQSSALWQKDYSHDKSNPKLQIPLSWYAHISLHHKSKTSNTYLQASLPDLLILTSHPPKDGWALCGLLMPKDHLPPTCYTTREGNTLETEARENFFKS